MSDTGMVESQLSVSIVIVTWNGKKYALECLNSLRDSGMSLTTEIIVVDNGSTDGTPEAIHELFPKVTVIENRSNLGFAKANNVGVESAKGKYICLINSDVVVPPGTLKNMFAYMEQNPSIGVLGPKMISPEGGVGRSVMWLPTVWNTLCCAFGLHVVFKNSRLLGGFEASGYSYDRTEDVEVLTGWFWMVRRSALEQVGLLDEQFFMYGEDIDWCYRFRQAGWRVVFYCDAQALHYGAASSSNQPVRFHIEMRRANLQCFRKHHGWFSCLGFALATWLHELVRIGGYSTVFLFDRNHREELILKIERSLACLGWLCRFQVKSSRRVINTGMSNPK